MPPTVNGSFLKRFKDWNKGKGVGCYISIKLAQQTKSKPPHVMQIAYLPLTMSLGLSILQTYSRGSQKAWHVYHAPLKSKALCPALWERQTRFTAAQRAFSFHSGPFKGADRGWEPWLEGRDKTNSQYKMFLVQKNHFYHLRNRLEPLFFTLHYVASVNRVYNNWNDLMFQ